MTIGPRRFYQRRATDCLLTALECFTQKPREEMGEGNLELLPGGYLSYRSVPRVIPDAPFTTFVTHRGHSDTLTKEPIPMILGIRMPGHPPGVPVLHSVFYDGRRVWEPGAGKYMREDITDLKIVYAIVSADGPRHYGVGLPPSTMAQWGVADPTKPVSAEEQERLIKAGVSGSMFLRVVG